MLTAGIEVRISNLAPRRALDNISLEPYTIRAGETPGTINLFHTIASEIPGHTEPSVPRKAILLTAWETDLLPDDWLPRLGRMSEIWVPSHYNRDVFRKSVDTVFCIPHPFVPRPEGNTALINKMLGFNKNDFVFYSILGWQERKYPLGIIQAFLRAFPKTKDVRLVLKTMFGLEKPAVAEAATRDIMQQFSPLGLYETRITVVAGLWPEPLIDSLTSRGNCYVSLHRGEAWCYPLFDAVCVGKPTIATNYSGPVDYLNPVYHNLVPFTLTPVTQNYHPYRSHMHWAEPDIETALLQMRHVYDNRELVCDRAIQGAAIVRAQYSLERVGGLILQRLTDNPV